MSSQWQFALIDYTQDSVNGITTPINEPVGWDSMTLHLKRDENLHGFFSFEDDSFGSMQYDGPGADVLRHAYYTFGVNAKVQLQIGFLCEPSAPADDNLYLGQFDFTTFVDYIEDRCYVECATIVSQSLMLYKKRADQQVDLDSLASTDQMPVQQWITVAADFQSGTNQIRAGQLLNGLMAGSIITISGAKYGANNGSFSVASAKPDYQNVNPDTTGGTLATSFTCSGTLNAINKTLSVNLELSIAVGGVITIQGTGNITSGNGPDFISNDGDYVVTSFQQFFGYTVFNINLQSIAGPGTSVLNYGTDGTPAGGAYFTEQYLDTMVISASFVSSSLPTKTIIQVPLQPVELLEEKGSAVNITGKIDNGAGKQGTWLTVATASANNILPGMGIGINSLYILSQLSGTAGGAGVYQLAAQVSSDLPVLNDSLKTTTGILLGASFLVNNLPAYKYLGKVITIPSKEIVAQTVYKAVEDIICPLLNNGQPAGIGGPYEIFLNITPGLPAIVADIDESDVGQASPVWGTNIQPYNNPNCTPPNTPPDTLIFFRQGSLSCSGDITVSYNINYNVFMKAEDPGWNDGVPGSKYAQSLFHLVIAHGTDPAVDPQNTANQLAHVQFTAPMNSPGNITGSIPAFDFPPGSYLWAWIECDIKNIQDGWCPGLLIGAGSNITIGIASLCEATPCAVYFVNEALSRCAENYTNGAMSVYSDYFGRRNAQPVPSQLDGCGAMQVITNGLRVRGSSMPDNSGNGQTTGSALPKMFTSLREMFESLDAVHNIGVGLEYVGGNYRLRVEPFEWFFKTNAAMLNCDGIMKIERSTQNALLPSTFDVGYQQFETWNNNGLYDIFGKRSYRTPLNAVQKNVSKLCKWMASDYAIEFTRREFGLTTADSRYDSENFILCLQQKWTGGVECNSGQCIYVIDPFRIFANGQQITVSGSLHNNFSNATIIDVEDSCIAYPLQIYCLYLDTAVTIVNELAEEAKVTLVSGGGIHDGYNVTWNCLFVDSRGVIALLNEPMYGLQTGDSLNVQHTSFSDFPFYNVASISGLGPINGIASGATWPMLIFMSGNVLTNAAPFRVVCNPKDVVIQNNTNAFYAVEQGVVNGTNILSPETVMNYRISPAHNALRHYKNIITDRDYANQQLTFTGGQGNFYALGMLEGDCALETQNISEGGNLSLDSFISASEGVPVFFAEIIKFEYPLTWAQFITIQSNPYCLINYRRLPSANLISPWMQGWLADLQYNPYTGMAKFEIYPSVSVYTDQLPDHN